ncbi:MAG: hypothetical protein LBH96_04355 [Candidatus Peribacteria bacterium]|jgi:DNA-binding transcriptional regulator/RsmH inhibitor MraZ|nr:hypothetical protein [Candidatus Peribacteria bacterium]
MLLGTETRDIDHKNRIAIPKKFLKELCSHELVFRLKQEKGIPFMEIYEKEQREQKYQEKIFASIFQELSNIPNGELPIHSEGRITLTKEILHHLFGSEYRNIHQKQLIFWGAKSHIKLFTTKDETSVGKYVQNFRK